MQSVLGLRRGSTCPKFSGLKRAASINEIWVVNAGWEDVPSLDLDLRACSSRLVRLATSSFKLSNSFFMLGV